MTAIFTLFDALKAETSADTEGYQIKALPDVTHHKIGVSPNGQPIFFIKCDAAETSKYLDSNFEFITVQYSRKCQLMSDNTVEEGVYTSIALKTDAVDLQKYFLEIVFLVIKDLPTMPTLKVLKSALEQLIELFSQFTQPPQKTIQGLWAELLVIEQSKNVDYLIQAWHNSPFDTFDFNDGTDKIEVKSTARSRRIHSFSAQQLTPNLQSNLLIASTFVVETGVGTSIFDLMDSIDTKIKADKLKLRLKSIVAQTLGNSLEKAFDVYFDYPLAVDTLQFYDSKDIPHINIQDIPAAITNIRFDSDLTDIEPIKISTTKSLLHNALF